MTDSSPPTIQVDVAPESEARAREVAGQELAAAIHAETQRLNWIEQVEAAQAAADRCGSTANASLHIVATLGVSLGDARRFLDPEDADRWPDLTELEARFHRIQHALAQGRTA